MSSDILMWRRQQPTKEQSSVKKVRTFI